MVGCEAAPGAPPARAGAGLRLTADHEEATVAALAETQVLKGRRFGNVVLAGGVAWARVEGRKHYPSDILFGAALGHFVTAFIHDAFLNLPDPERASLTTFPVEAGAGIQLAIRF